MYVPQQVTREDVERSSTMTPSDVGRWYVLVNGTFQFQPTLRAARKLADQLNKDNANNSPDSYSSGRWW